MPPKNFDPELGEFLSNTFGLGKTTPAPPPEPSKPTGHVAVVGRSDNILRVKFGK